MSQPNYQLTPPAPTPQKKGRSNTTALILAICVAIVPMIFIFGIIAAIAIPNFQKFGARAKQSEAKTSLSLAYTGEKSFIAEWNVATSDVQSLGLEASNDLTQRYQIGFAQPAVAQWDVIGIDPSTHDPARSDTEKLGRQLKNDLGAPFAELAAKYCPDCVVDGENFKIVAIGNLDADETLDVWTMDQDRLIKNISDDTSN